ncbi:MAG TPA: glycoside hydrolase family 32 protein [Myxococcota bacterium]|nr:glycoside hydrolase family 32 protein [Myxococcota bacterium]
MKIFPGAIVPTLAGIIVISGCGGAGDTSDELLPPGTQTTHLETYRPQLHYTPAYGWMNDPNGLILHRGTWHMYHQYIPGEYVIDRMNWGHATSTDLVRWEYRPVAISTNPELGMAYSGSAIADPDNTTGLCTGDPADCILAFFTHSLMLGGDQKQSLAASSDGGLTFVEYGDNPIMANPGKTNFRDPKVFMFDESQARARASRIGPVATQWNMVLAQGKQIGLYVSGNLIEWQPLSTFDNNPDWTGGVWECPDLFRMPVQDEPGAFKWVLITSVFDGAPWDGSGVMYFTGDFDGTTFTPDDPDLMPRWLDHGPDFYAAQTFANVPDSDGRRILIAWMNNWKYAMGIPAMPWQGAMAIPRQLNLVRDGDGTLTLTQAPVSEFKSLRRGRVVELTDITSGSAALPVHSSDTGMYEIDITAPRWDKWSIGIASMTALMQPDGAEMDPMPITENARVEIGIDNGILSIDRTGAICDECPASMERIFTAILETGLYGDGTALSPHKAGLIQADYLVTLKIIVDRSGVEVFADDGRTTMTAQAFLPGPAFTVTLETPEATPDRPVIFDSIDLYELFSIWAVP